MSFEPQTEEQAVLAIAAGLRNDTPILAEIAALEEGTLREMPTPLGVTVARLLAVAGAKEPLGVMSLGMQASGSPQLLMEVGVAAAIVGDLERATQLLQWAATAPQPEPTAWNSLARVLAMRGLWSDALRAAGLGVAALPGDRITARTAELLIGLNQQGAERLVDRHPWRASIASGAVQLGLTQRAVLVPLLGLGLDDGLMLLARRARELDPQGRYDALLQRVSAAITGG